MNKLPNNPIDYSQVDLKNPQDWQRPDVVNKEFPQIPEKTFKHLIRNREAKGLAPIVKHIGKYLFVNRKGFGHYMVSC